VGPYQAAAELGDTVERVSSWVGRARGKARQEQGHQAVSAALEVKRKAEAEVEGKRAEKRRITAFFGRPQGLPPSTRPLISST